MKKKQQQQQQQHAYWIFSVNIHYWHVWIIHMQSFQSTTIIFEQFGSLDSVVFQILLFSFFLNSYRGLSVSDVGWGEQQQYTHTHTTHIYIYGCRFVSSIAFLFLSFAVSPFLTNSFFSPHSSFRISLKSPACHVFFYSLFCAEIETKIIL